MGIWDFISSTTDTVRRNAPDCVPAVKNACTATFSYCHAVGVNGLHKVNEYIPDQEARAKIGVFAIKFAKNTAFYALHEGYKLVPGGTSVAKIASKTMNEMKSEDRKAGAQLMKASTECRGTFIARSNNQPPCTDSIGNQKPEDVLRIFMMKEFVGIHFLDDLIVPGRKRSK